MLCRFQFTKAAAIAAALAATVLLAPSSASAEESPVTIYAEPNALRTEMVSFARLDLAAERDRKRLQRKVGAAVERVCLRDIGRDGLQDRDFYACEDKAWDSASLQIASAVSRASNLALSGAAPIAATAIRVSAF